MAVKIRSSTPTARPGFREKTCVGGFTSEFTVSPEVGNEACRIGWEHREELLDIARSLLPLGQRPVIVWVETWSDHGPGLPTSLARCRALRLVQAHTSV